MTPLITDTTNLPSHNKHTQIAPPLQNTTTNQPTTTNRGNDRSFHGGTDVDRPLQLSLERLASAEWSQADILMVTDGEINPPSEDLLAALAAAREDLGLEVHGLLVSGRASEPMQRLCTGLHMFKSWTAVGAESYMYN